MSQGCWVEGTCHSPYSPFLPHATHYVDLRFVFGRDIRRESDWFIIPLGRTQLLSLFSLALIVQLHLNRKVHKDGEEGTRHCKES